MCITDKKGCESQMLANTSIPFLSLICRCFVSLLTFGRGGFKLLHSENISSLCSAFHFLSNRTSFNFLFYSVWFLLLFLLNYLFNFEHFPFRMIRAFFFFSSHFQRFSKLYTDGTSYIEREKCVCVHIQFVDSFLPFFV